MASVSVDLLIGRIFSVLESEASLLEGVGEEINELKWELSAMGSFLMDTENKNGLTEGEKTWVAQVRGIAYQVEIIIDEFTYHINSQQVGGRFTKFLRKTFYLPKNLWARRQIATKLQKINKTMRAIPEINRRYGVERIDGSSSSHNNGNWLQHLGDSSFLTNEDYLVGIESERQLLMGWLMDGEPQLSVVSLVGMGGSGKTTLAAKTCTDETVKQYSGVYAWITISKTYVLDDLFRRLIKELYGATKEEIPPDLRSMAYKDLLFLLVSYLKTRRYLVVLDDVWDVKFLMEMTMLFQNSHLGSRIIVTTRNEDVGSFSFGVPSRSHHIQPLSMAESWTLFSVKAFSNRDNKSCPSEIEVVARELVGRCNGLPLAIVALGGLMVSKRTKEEWNMVLRNLSWQLNNNPMLEAVTKRILFLSFNDLPYRLKHCFLYCSIFPEDYHILGKRLIRLWLAEGFVEPVNRVMPYEVAESYLFELISRSMLQVVERSEDVRPEVCKMHDLLRELALSTSEKEGFFVMYDSRQTLLEDHETRRLSVQKSGEELKSYSRASQLQSLLVFVKDSEATLSFSDMLPSGLKLLRVLDLENVQIDKLPRELPYFFNLRYLNLRGTPIKELPELIGNLHNLETLDIMETQIEKLPSGIAKCKSLIHLIMYRYTDYNSKLLSFKHFSGTQVPSTICKLTKLRVMTAIVAGGDIIKQIGNMVQLTTIGITNVREEDETDLCVSISKLKLLQSLDLMVAGEETFLKIEALSSPPLLKNLILAGKLEKVPQWFPSLQNLTYLYLHWSRLTDDPLPHIGALPCLAELVLVNAYAGDLLRFLSGFVNLRRLYLRSFSQMTHIFIEKGVMPDLQILRLIDCMELKTLPHGIECLTNLEELYLFDVSEELVDLIRGDGALDHPKLEHIPRINHYHMTGNKMHYENLSQFSRKKPF